MTEAEILTQIGVHGDRIWSILQYWTSVSFAVLVAGHFAADRMHWLVLTLFSMLYVLFTWSCFNMLIYDGSSIGAALAQLQSISDEGELLGQLANNALNNAPTRNMTFSMWALPALCVGMLLATLVYPAYCHIKARK